MKVHTPWSASDKALLRALFLEQQLPIAEIAATLHRTTASINAALTNFEIPRRRSPRKLHMPTGVTPALARLHAHVCGDGHLIHNREKDDYGYLKACRRGYYRQRYAIAYTNTHPGLIREFMQDAQDVFGLRPRYVPRKYVVIVKSKDVWELMRNLGAGKSRDWSIGREFLEGPKNVQAAWVRAFFADEAHFDP